MICVLQFDAAAVAVVERLLAEGRLPNLAALRDRGRLHELETPATDFAAGAFPTLYSGVELGDHGLFYPFQWSAPEQRTRYATAFDAPPAVWERLAAAGLRTLAIDPYESRPPASANGVFVCGWGFCDRVVLPRWSRPAGAAREHLRRHGRGPEATEIFGRPRPAELLRLRRVLIEAPERIAALAEELLARERFDLAWLTFSAAHLAGHQFWDLSQVDERSLDPEARALLASALDEVYVAVDRAFGRVLAALPAGADVIVTSAVGMGVNTSRADLLPEMLAAVLAGGPIEPDGAGAIWRLRASMPAGLRGAIARAIPDRAALALTARLELRGIDWANTPAFAHPADNQGYVRLNLRGRERGGVVAPEAAEGLMEEISAGLASLSGPRRSARRGLRGASGEAVPGPACRPASRSRGAVVGPACHRAHRAALRALRDGASPRERLRALRQPHARRRLGAGSARAGDARRPRPAAAARRRRGDDLRAHRRGPGRAARRAAAGRSRDAPRRRGRPHNSSCGWPG